MPFDLYKTLYITQLRITKLFNMKSILMIVIMSVPMIMMANKDIFFFDEGNYLTAKKKAELTGKFQLLEFGAAWCTPCKHMNQTTFKDPQVLNYLDEYFVSVKIDIDQFDGFALKQKYEIKYLPTLVILNSKGEIIGRIEEAVGPTKLLSRLENLTNKSITSIPTTQQEDSPVDAPSPEVGTSITESKPEIRVPDEPKKPTMPAALKPQKRSILQFGVFGNKENAINLSDKVMSYLPSSPEIMTISSGNKTLYKVVYGPFNDEKEATDLQQELEANGIKTLIKPLE